MGDTWQQQISLLSPTSHQSPHLTSHLTPVCHLTSHLTGRRLTFKVGKCKHLKGCLREHVFLAQASVRPLLHVLIHHKRRPYAGTLSNTGALRLRLSLCK